MLLRDGMLVAAVEEERFRRVEHWACFPSPAIAKVLRMEGISGAQISHATVSREPRRRTLHERLLMRFVTPARLFGFERAKGMSGGRGGRMKWRARALGNRSMSADPLRADMRVD